MMHCRQFLNCSFIYGTQDSQIRTAVYQAQLNQVAWLLALFPAIALTPMHAPMLTTSLPTWRPLTLALHISSL